MSDVMAPGSRPHQNRLGFKPYLLLKLYKCLLSKTYKNNSIQSETQLALDSVIQLVNTTQIFLNSISNQNIRSGAFN